MMYGWNMTGWGWAWMGLFPVVLIIALVLVVRLFTREPGSQLQRAEEDSAREMLRRRFASGEIEEDEFKRRLALLESTTTKRLP